ncbi:golgin subfamily A member 6-like protein 22 isoform X2 [Alosa sapidissima]|uniref:golgin subfamily A member 6-like protein 22 isoform X2 n=1 Tax=Alosa sapidissima TaxID=34773 RepID=UPI001C08E6F4|nr:golgin subfamily A member 6-like protein 22 isoform X2 [Alosa sapidissima]
MRFLWIFNCCKAQQEDDDAEQPWFIAREFETVVWYGFDSEWESIQERKQRLKRYSLEELKRQLELFGITIVEVKGQKKSEKKMKREYRKLLMRRMKMVETERARRSVQVRRGMEPEQKMDLVQRGENGLDQESENTQDEKQSLETSAELIPERQGLRKEAQILTNKVDEPNNRMKEKFMNNIKEEETQEEMKTEEIKKDTEEKRRENQEREDNKEDIKDDEVGKVNEKDFTDAQEEGWKQELDLKTKTHGEKEEEVETDFNKIKEEDDILKEGKCEKTVTEEGVVTVEESKKKQENTDDAVASGTMATVSLELMQNEGHEEKQEEAAVKEERINKDGKEKQEEEENGENKMEEEEKGENQVEKEKDTEIKEEKELNDKQLEEEEKGENKMEKEKDTEIKEQMNNKQLQDEENENKMEKEKDTEGNEEEKLNDKLEEEEKGENKVEKEKDAEVKGKELHYKQLNEQKEEEVNMKENEGQEEVTEYVVETKEEKKEEDTDKATALVKTKTVSNDVTQSEEDQEEELDVVVVEKETVKGDGTEEKKEEKEKEEGKELEDREEKEEKEKRLQEVQEQVKDCVVEVEEEVEENADDGTPQKDETTHSLDLMQNEDQEEKKERIERKEKFKREWKEEREEGENEMEEEKETEEVVKKVMEEQEERKECVVEVEDEKKEEDADETVALVSSLIDSHDLRQNIEDPEETLDVVVVERERMEEDGTEERKEDERQNETEERKGVEMKEVGERKEMEDKEKEEEKEELDMKEEQVKVKECVVEVEEEKEVQNAHNETVDMESTLDLTQNGNQEKRKENVGAEKEMMNKDEKKERKEEDDKEVVIKEKGEELEEVQEEKKAEDMKVKEEQEEVKECMVEKEQKKEVDATDGTVAMEIRPEVSQKRNATLNENRKVKKRMRGCRGGKSKNKHNQLEVYKHTYRSSGHTVEDGEELMDNKGKKEEEKKKAEKGDMKVQKEQEEVKECVVEEKEKEDTDDGAVAVETTLKVSLDSNTTINQEQEVKKRMRGCRGGKSKCEMTEENRQKQDMRYGHQHESQHRRGERHNKRQGVRDCWRGSNGCQTAPVGCWGDAKRCWRGPKGPWGGPKAHEEEKEKQDMRVKEEKEEVKQCVEEREEKDEEEVHNGTVTMATTLKVHLVKESNTTTNKDQELKKRMRGCRGGKSKNKQKKQEVYNETTEENRLMQDTKAGHQREFEHQHRGVERQNNREGVQAHWRGPQQEEIQTREDNQSQPRNQHRHNMAVRVYGTGQMHVNVTQRRRLEEIRRSDRMGATGEFTGIQEAWLC